MIHAKLHTLLNKVYFICVCVCVLAIRMFGAGCFAPNSDGFCDTEIGSTSFAAGTIPLTSTHAVNANTHTANTFRIYFANRRRSKRVRWNKNRAADVCVYENLNPD